MKKIIALVSMLGALGAIGCNPIDAAVDCHAICSRYRSCFDANYDVDACDSRCRARSIDNANYRMTTDNCDACMDEKSCATATFSCGLQCSAVVP